MGDGRKERKRKKKEGWKVRGRERDFHTDFFFFLRIVLRCQPLWKIALLFIFAKYPFLVL